MAESDSEHERNYSRKIEVAMHSAGSQLGPKILLGIWVGNWSARLFDVADVEFPRRISKSNCTKSLKIPRMMVYVDRDYADRLVDTQAIGSGRCSDPDMPGIETVSTRSRQSEVAVADSRWMLIGLFCPMTPAEAHGVISV